LFDADDGQVFELTMRKEIVHDSGDEGVDVRVAWTQPREDKAEPSVASSGGKPLLGTDWDQLLGEEFTSPYWADLQDFLDEERSQFCIHPSSEEVFKAFRVTPYKLIKVVILGQDPYHRPGLAHGLAFSVRHDVRLLPPSLKNIRKELLDDMHGEVSIPEHGSLESWARRGVLLLNTVLTVRQGEKRSHRRKGWEQFTDQVIKVVNSKPARVVFMLWGEDAQEKKPLIEVPKHAIIESSHPSPQSAHKARPIPFLGSKPFSRANTELTAAGEEGINWSLVEP
jgi:uracil-DNA glycosylase